MRHLRHLYAQRGRDAFAKKLSDLDTAFVIVICKCELWLTLPLMGQTTFVTSQRDDLHLETEHSDLAFFICVPL